MRQSFEETNSSLKRMVLKRVKPKIKEISDVRKFVADLEETASFVSKIECITCGSFGKGTWLSGNHDIDLFMLFDRLVSRKELEEKGLEFGREIARMMKGKIIIKYSEHPYVNITSRGFVIDVVPCYRMKPGEDIKSAVDRSPLHMSFVKDNMTDQMKDEARLLKQFCKGIGVYGSDATHMGFSGYICELLIIKYRTFENVLRSALEWSAQQMIYFHEPAQVRFINQPLVIVDPTDAKRNAAANVSGENFAAFMEASAKYLKKPSMNFFFPGKPMPLSPAELKSLLSRKTFFMALEFPRPDLIEDALYPQLRRLSKRLENLMFHNDFLPLRVYEFVSQTKVSIIFEFDSEQLTPIKKLEGPHIFAKRHAEEFVKKYRGSKGVFGPYVSGISWFVERRRLYTRPQQLLKALIAINEKKLEEDGVPKNLAKAFRKSRIVDRRFWNYMRKNKYLSMKIRRKYFPDKIF